MSDFDGWHTLEGKYNLALKSGDIVSVQIKRSVVDSHGQLMWIESVGGVIYNGPNIISIQKLP